MSRNSFQLAFSRGTQKEDCETVILKINFLRLRSTSLFSTSNFLKPLSFIKQNYRTDYLRFLLQVTLIGCFI